MNVNAMEEIERIERIMKPLTPRDPSTDGSVTTILDVLKGTVTIRTLKQEFEPCSHEIASKLSINPGHS